jgi:hypothetical protein
MVLGVDVLGGLLDILLEAVVACLNALIAALGAVLAALFALLPDLPDLPELPDAVTTAESWVAWFFPIGTVVDILVWGFTMWLLWQAVAIALRWAKALGD